MTLIKCSVITILTRVNVCECEEEEFLPWREASSLHPWRQAKSTRKKKLCMTFYNSAQNNYISAPFPHIFLHLVNLMKPHCGIKSSKNFQNRTLSLLVWNLDMYAFLDGTKSTKKQNCMSIAMAMVIREQWPWQ